MTHARHIGTALGWTSIFVLLCLFGVVTQVSAVPASSSTTLPPHVATEYSTDVCAMCHRTHTAPSRATWASDETTGSALLGSPTEDDVDLCYSCHGIESLGSGTEIQNAFESGSGHSLALTSSAFGPPRKTCATCHDTHGSARISSGTPYPALLRVSTGGADVYAGDAVCTSCHVVRANSLFPGATVWAQTPHAKIATQAAGTGIVCSECHDPHGSSIAPALRSGIDTPAASDVATVTGNTRSQCLACHTESYGQWPGGTGYVGSAHASATATTTVEGEWASVETTRLAGECQSCHAPMGAADGSGALIPDLKKASDQALCERCHRAGGAAMTDFASLAYSDNTPGLEVVAAYRSSVGRYDRVQLFSREATDAAPPRVLRDLRPLSSVSAAAAGDLDGDSVSEVGIASTNGRFALLKADAASVVTRTVQNLPGGKTASKLAMGKVFWDASPGKQLVYAASDGTVEVAQYLGGTLYPIASTTVTGTPSAIAVGDLLGGMGDEIAIVSAETDRLYVITDDGLNGLRVATDVATTRQDPVALDIANLDSSAATREIAVANAGEATDVVSLYRADGTAYEHGGGVLPAGQPTAILAANILPSVHATDTSGAELAVAYADGTGQAGVRVMTAPSASVVSAIDTSTGNGSAPSSLAFGDADGDGDGDLAVGLAGSFTRTNTAVAPAISVLGPNAAGDDLGTRFTLAAGGAESAGGTATVLVADIGAIGPARHPVGAVPGSHETTEEVPAARHVECADCHNVHRSRGASADTSDMPGSLIGALGVRPRNTGPETAVLERVVATREYEVCFSCHSAWAGTATSSTASLVNTMGASFHPIEGPAKPNNAVGDTLLGYETGDTILCSSCHTSSSGPQGPHRSSYSGLLGKPFAGTSAENDSALCVSCHDPSVYLTGASDGVDGTASGFRDGASGVAGRLHARHAAGLGFTCGSCHDSHGSPLVKHLLRRDVFTWTEDAGGGSCSSTSCHTGGLTKTYVR